MCNIVFSEVILSILKHYLPKSSYNSIFFCFSALGREGFSYWRDRMLEKFQPIKIAKRSYWLNAFLIKLTSILRENVNKIIIIDADRIGADKKICFLFFHFPIYA